MRISQDRENEYSKQRECNWCEKEGERRGQYGWSPAKEEVTAERETGARSCGLLWRSKDVSCQNDSGHN